MTTVLTTDQAIGREVKAWMGRADIKQKDLSELLGVTQAAISKKLSGRTSFTMEELLRVSSLVGTSLPNLLGDGILNAKIPSTATNNEGEKQEAPIGFIPNGTSYDVVAGARFELATSGLQAPIWGQVITTILLLQKSEPHTALQLKDEA